MLKAKCIECSNKGFATFLFEGKHPKVNEYYHLEEQTGKSLELNGLFHSIIPEFYYWMLKNDTFIFDDGGIELDFRCPSWQSLRELLKQRYGIGNYVRFVNDKMEMEKCDVLEDVPLYALDDFNNGNTKRIMKIIRSWRDYKEDEASRLVDIIIKLMNKLGVDTPKYLNIIGYLENKQINKVVNKFEGSIIN